MTINEAIGVSIFGIDRKTGEVISSEAEWQRMIEYLGGVDEVAKYIPFPIDELKKKIKVDPNLNNTSLHEWSKSAGFLPCYGTGNVLFAGGGIWELYGKKGITSASCADGVCILKEAARIKIEQGQA